MSAVDLRGPEARVDRWDSSESSQDRRVGVWRLRWLGTLLVAPLVMVAVGFVGQDSAERAAFVEAVVDAVAVSEPPEPTLPLAMNPRVERWMKAFETTRRMELDDLLARREIYAEMIRGKLRARAMPQELLYIPMIESGLSPSAVSPVSAVGMWQFMSPTAVQYGLRVDEYVDERRDPVAATDAALDYLEWLHGRFEGSWYLAAAAYNAGPGRLERILKRYAADREWTEDLYWEILAYLPRETREYVPKMIAVTKLANDADALGFPASDYAPYRYDNVFVPGGTTLKRVARALDVDERALWLLNPHLTRGITPPNEMYGVRIPVGGGATVVNALAESSTPRFADD